MGLRKKLLLTSRASANHRRMIRELLKSIRAIKREVQRLHPEHVTIAEVEDFKRLIVETCETELIAGRRLINSSKSISRICETLAEQFD